MTRELTAPLPPWMRAAEAANPQPSRPVPHPRAIDPAAETRRHAWQAACPGQDADVVETMRQAVDGQARPAAPASAFVER